MHLKPFFAIHFFDLARKNYFHFLLCILFQNFCSILFLKCIWCTINIKCAEMLKIGTATLTLPISYMYLCVHLHLTSASKHIHVLHVHIASLYMCQPTYLLQLHGRYLKYPADQIFSVNTLMNNLQ